ncbi:MAG TPA: HDOD domain-containing protein [Myxococcota bacterium]
MDSAPVIESDRIVMSLRALFSSTTYHPPLPPPVAAEILAISHSSNTDLRRVVSLLESDPMLAGAALKIAQSPAYAPTGARVLSLHDSVSRLGLRGVQQVVLEAALNLRIFTAPGFSAHMNRARRHSAAVAAAARALCRYASGVDASAAFLCGLFHDVGVAACFIAVSDSPERYGASWSPELANAIAEVHESASRIIAELWRVGPDICAILASHHAALRVGSSHPIVAALALAECVAEEKGCALDAPDATARIDAKRVDVVVACECLGINPRLWKTAKADAERAITDAH